MGSRTLCIDTVIVQENLRWLRRKVSNLVEEKYLIEGIKPSAPPVNPKHFQSRALFTTVPDSRYS